jgi:hypothetical protein
MALVQTAISTVIRPSVADSVFPAAAIWNLKPLRKEVERPARYPQAPAFSTQMKQPFQDRELTRLRKLPRTSAYGTPTRSTTYLSLDYLG